MSADMKRWQAAEALLHQRARMLSAESVDGPLAADDAAWLDGHVASCPDCAAVSREYRANHLELRGLAAPEPPRDLWARTSAALDMVAPAGRSGARGPARAGKRPLFGTAAAVGVVVVVATASLLGQSPIGTPRQASTTAPIAAVQTGASVAASTSPQAPLAVVGGTSYWIAAHADVYEIKGGAARCRTATSSCSVADNGGQTLGSVKSNTAISAAIAPDATRAAVWTDDKVAVLPLSTQPKTVSLEQLTPRPAAAATAARTAAATAAPTATPTHEPTAVPASAGSPVPTTEPTPSPKATPVPTPVTAAGQPVAILTGYEVVGRDPEFSADGKMLVFAARPSDHSAGPDVFVWRAGQERAKQVTTSHNAMLAGWLGRTVLISEIAAYSASGATGSIDYASYTFDPISGAAKTIDRPMLLPVSDPTGRFLVYWSGSVEFDPVSGLWRPGAGDLTFEAWANLQLSPGWVAPGTASTPQPSAQPATQEPSASPAGATVASPTASPETQPLAPQALQVTAQLGQVHNWAVSWDAGGQHVAIWVADPGSSRIGRLSLFSIDRKAGRLDTNEPLLAAEKVMDGIGFDNGHLVYTSAVDGRTHMEDIPAVPPSAVSTPSPTTPGETPSEPAAQPSAAQPTDQAAPLP